MQGFLLSEVMALDMPGFLSLLKSIRKVKAADKTTDAWTAYVAAASDYRAMKDHVRQIGRDLRGQEDDSEELIALLGAKQ